MTEKEIIAVVTAYKEEKEIEVSVKGENDWQPLLHPYWNFENRDYRIKPEPHYRQFKNAEEVMEAIKEHGGYVKEGNTYRYLKKFTVHGDGPITYTLSGWSSTAVRDWDAIHDKITWADGTPFGKLEE